MKADDLFVDSLITILLIHRKHESAPGFPERLVFGSGQWALIGAKEDERGEVRLHQ